MTNTLGGTIMFSRYYWENEWQMLHTQGNWLLNQKSQPVRLVGVNCAPLVWTSRCENLREMVCTACDSWKANAIRLPLSQDRWFGFGVEQKDADETGRRYRSQVDSIVEAVASRRKYVILDLHRSNCNTWGEFISGGLSDMNSLVFWKDLASRYRNHPNVLFDLYNEPFQISWDTWKNGGEITAMYEESDVGQQIMFAKDDNKSLKKIRYQVPGMQRLIETVRGVGANNVLVVGGLDWSYELDGVVHGYALDDCGGNGIILDAHLYPCKALDRWDDCVTVAAEKYPILIGECGHYGEAPIPHEWPQLERSDTWVPKLLKWVDEHGYHITAWDFHHTAGPCLIENPEDYTPTPYWGAYFKKFLESHNR